MKFFFAPFLIVNVGDDCKQVDVIGRGNILRVDSQKAY